MSISENRFISISRCSWRTLRWHSVLLLWHSKGIFPLLFSTSNSSRQMWPTGTRRLRSLLSFTQTPVT